jgi:hypothetical protein
MEVSRAQLTNNDGLHVYGLSVRERVSVQERRLQAESMLSPRENLLRTIVVRQASRADRPAIARFVEAAYGAGARYKAPPHWNWQFIDNPFRRHSDEVPVWVAVDGDRVVGQIAVQWAQLQVAGETLAVGWAVDIIILPDYRAVGLGHRLHDAVASNVDMLASLKMAPASRRMAESHDCVTLGEVHQLTRWARLNAAGVRRYVLMRTANHRLAHMVARVSCSVFQGHYVFTALANPLLHLRDIAKRRPLGPTTTRVVEVARFGSEVDELWARTRGDYSVICPRDAQFLNWRFVDCPEPSYRCFVAERDGRVAGYVVLRYAEPVELPQGIIADLYASRQDRQTIDMLIRHSLTFFGSTVPTVECGTSVAEFEAAFRAHGFFKTRTHRPTCICQDSAVRNRLGHLKNDCFFSRGDHDWDQVSVADPDIAGE